MSENSNTSALGTRVRPLKALVLYPLWVLLVFMCSVAAFSGVQLTDSFHIPGILELLRMAGVPFDAMNESVLAVILTVAIWVLVLAVVMLAPRVVRRGHTVTKQDLGLKRLPTWSDIGLGLVAFIPYIMGTIAVLYLASMFLPIDLDQEQQIGFDTAIASQLNYFMAFLALVVIGPFVEELLFRGYLYGKLRRYGAIVAALVVSALFGFMHGQWNVALDVFVLSLVMCALRERTGTIWAGVVLHMFKNSIAYYVLFIAPLLVH